MLIKKTNHKGVLSQTPQRQYKDLQNSLYYDSDRKRYWASIMPCAISDWAMECSPMDGKSELILRVANRRSKKSDQEAIAIFDSRQTAYLQLIEPTPVPVEVEA